ncbi:nucleotide-binding protein [Ectobacillus sp. JY-23]|uniref:TIR domain-containing protein n=1 Tax=Ectobacillus sp. JY-23 TaxID=2933872 RepID=UPI001FF49F03|nr:TIR domain-containing protein [Ectobacillus sp. JY-23]UOY92516.1 nucleotide-binding protein [Ectobacillus sp. JY-23]
MEQTKPSVFIGSSREAMEYVNAVQKALEYHAEVNPWYAGVFQSGNYTMQDLEEQLQQNDFAVFICSPDDIIHIRGKTFLITRDNTLFEMGLFWGKLRKERVFYLLPKTTPKPRDDIDLEGYHFLSDLVGVNPLTYQTDVKNYDAAVSVSCQHIIKQIKALQCYKDPETRLQEVEREQKVRDAAALFILNLAKELIRSDKSRLYDFLKESLQAAYAIFPGFNNSGVGVWKKEGSDGLKHVAGKVGSVNFYPFHAKDEQKRVLVVESFLKGEVLVHLTHAHLFHTYLICYPIGKDLVITITMDGRRELSEEETRYVIVANQELMGTINYLFGGAS